MTTETLENAPEVQERTGSRQLKPADFFQFINAYPDQSGTRLYLWRKYPEISQQLAGYADNYIFRKDGPPYWQSEDGVFAEHGGGKFSLSFNDKNQAGSQVAYCTIDKSWQELEPLLNYATLLNTPNNQPYLQHLIAKGDVVIDPETKKVIPVMNRPAPGNTHTATVVSDPTTQHVMAKLLDQMMAERQKPVGIAELIAMMTALRPADQPKTDPAILKMIEEQAANNRLLLEKLLAKEAPAPPPREQAAAPGQTTENVIEGFFQAYDKVAARLGGKRTHGEENTSPYDWLKEPLTQFAQASQPFWEALAWRFGPGQRNAQNGNNNGQQQQRQPPGIAGPAPEPQKPGAQQQQAQPDQAQQQPNPPPGQQQPQNGQATLVRVLSERMKRCMDNGNPGSSLAISVDVEAGRTTYNRICALGKDGIKNAMKDHAPDYWQNFAAIEDQLDTFIDEFLNAFEEA